MEITTGRLNGGRKEAMVELDLRIVRGNTRSCLVTDGTREEWLPISQIEDIQEIPGAEFSRITIPEWLARDRELI